MTHPVTVVRELRRQRIDMVIDFDQWVRITPLLGYLTGAKFITGFRTKGQARHYLYDRYVDHDRARHEVDCFLSLIEPLGCRTDDGRLEFSVSPGAHEKAAALLEKVNPALLPLVVFHPATPLHGSQRQWPAAKYVELGRLLRHRKPCVIAVSGTEGEKAANGHIVKEIGAGAVLLPPVSIEELAAVFSRSSVVVCGNTGVMHLASAVDAPVVALHGPTDPVKWGPRSTFCRVVSAGLPCSPCLYLGFEYGCDRNTCLEAISPENVLGAIEEILALASDNIVK